MSTRSGAALYVVGLLEKPAAESDAPTRAPSRPSVGFRGAERPGGASKADF